MDEKDGVVLARVERRYCYEPEMSRGTLLTIWQIQDWILNLSQSFVVYDAEIMI